MKRLYFGSLFIFTLSLAIYGYFQWHESQQQVAEDISTELIPDFVAESLNSRIYDKSGKLAFSIAAARMEHYGDLGFTQFEYPKYTIYPKNQGAPWLLSANEATLSAEHRLSLENKVVLTATQTDSLVQNIQAKYLELDLNSNLLTSEQALLVQGQDFTLYGSGLIVDLNTSQLTLTNHVQTIYQNRQH